MFGDVLKTSCKGLAVRRYVAGGTDLAPIQTNNMSATLFPVNTFRK